MTPAELFASAWAAADSVQPFGEGHINDSYLVESAGDRYLLQRMSNRVFTEPEQIMVNIQRVTRHLSGSSVRLPTLVLTADGATHVLSEGAVWRVWRLLSGRSLSALNTPRQAESIGRAFGRFQNALVSLPGEPWPDPIDGFLQLDHYLAEYARVPGKRPATAFDVDALTPLAERFHQRTGYIHGDCKVNNVLFDAAGEVCAVLDLDTVMWGHWAWDFGDLVRSACACDGRFHLPYFSAVLRGFVDETGRDDIDALCLSPCYVAGMLGVRFLTDHLLGDRYFKVNEAGENLRRAEQQFALLHSMEAQLSDMKRTAEQEIERGMQQ